MQLDENIVKNPPKTIDLENRVDWLIQHDAGVSHHNMRHNNK